MFNNTHRRYEKMNLSDAFIFVNITVSPSIKGSAIISSYTWTHQSKNCHEKNNIFRGVREDTLTKPIFIIILSKIRTVKI